MMIAGISDIQQTIQKKETKKKKGDYVYSSIYFR